MLQKLNNEKGMLLPATIFLLLLVTASIISITSAYQTKYRTYDSLELTNINATIIKIENFKKRQNNTGM
jgi:hypothetical protein